MTTAEKRAVYRTSTVAGVLLLAIYVASMAPSVTLWDAGEFIAAIHTLGVPHPPGTPLFILLGKAWTIAVAWLPAALALNLLSAVCTAAAGALTALLVYRSTRSPVIAVASALIAGTMSTAWINATETEVYAASLLLSIAMIIAADEAGRTGNERWVILCAYLIALSVPLHLSALIAAPAAIVLAADRFGMKGPVSWTAADPPGWRQLVSTWTWAWVVLLAGVVVLAVAASSASRTLVIVGACLLAVAAQLLGRESRSSLAIVVPLILVALSALAFMLVRAGSDPGINQGDPSTLERWTAVITREQYAIHPLWPRMAPLWIQIGNVLQYVDWQLALGLAPEPPLSAARGAATLIGIVLGVIGCEEHRRLDPRRWRGVFVLLLSGSLGVMTYLNLEAGPSIGWDILPDDAPHEPRERDYFFVLAFWAWGIWIAIGVAALLRKTLRAAGQERREAERHLAGRVRAPDLALIALALVPTALNWRAVERRSEPGASVARLSALAFLSSAPRRAVLFVAGDNDSYPVWYLQHVERFRTDVTVVTIPIIPAEWYRDELARRHGLRTPREWRGLAAAMAAIAMEARQQGRPVVAAVSVDPAERAALGQFGRLRGWVWETDSSGSAGQLLSITPVEDVLRAEAGLSTEDRQALAGATKPVPAADLKFLTPAQRYMLRLLACPRLAIESAHHKSAADSLDSTCNFR